MHDTFDQVPATADEYTSSLKSFLFVKLGIIRNQLVIIEKKTGEPLQFVVGGGLQGPALQAHVEKLADHWDWYYETEIDRVARR